MCIRDRYTTAQPNMQYWNQIITNSCPMTLVFTCSVDIALFQERSVPHTGPDAPVLDNMSFPSASRLWCVCIFILFTLLNYRACEWSLVCIVAGCYDTSTQSYRGSGCPTDWSQHHLQVVPIIGRQYPLHCRRRVRAPVPLIKLSQFYVGLITLSGFVFKPH